jgi:DNA-binding CsgD family transcriptional regulator
LSVIEDPERRHPDGIESFAACVFVSDAFIAEFLAAPHPYFSAIIYERVLRGDSPILSLSAVRDGNSGPGLNLVCLHFCLRDPDLDHPRTRQALQVFNVAFFFFFAGYRINSLYQEVYGSQHAAYLKGGGLRLIADFRSHLVDKGTKPAQASQPYVFGLRKEEIAPAAVHPLSHLFHSLPPRFGFTGAAQRILERAMLNQTEGEIAEDLGVSPDAVKKTWRAIYQRVDDVAPHMLGKATRPVHEGQRSGEKRRHLLEYLRTHLEELRPANHGRSARPERHSLARAPPVR